jgi:hypothetical protein
MPEAFSFILVPVLARLFLAISRSIGVTGGDACFAPVGELLELRF